MANALTTQQKQTGIVTYLNNEAVRSNIAGVIGKENTTRFVSSVVSAVQANPALAKCTNASILSAALQGEALQLPPSPQLGNFYMVPFKTKKKVGNQWVETEEAQFQLGWKGMIQLAIRSGQYRNIVVSEIKENEADYNPITEEIDLHPIMDPATREKARTVGYYAMFELMNGFKKQLFMPIEAVQAHAMRYSRGYRYDQETGKKTSPWSTAFDSMAKKTLIRQLIGKWGIMSIEMQQAYVNDQSVIDENGNPVYVDNPQNVEARVHEDISTHANTTSFDEEVIDAEVIASTPAVEHVAEAVPVKEETPAETPKPKRSTKKAEPKPAPEPELIPDEVADDEMPEWGIS